MNDEDLDEEVYEAVPASPPRGRPRGAPAYDAPPKRAEAVATATGDTGRIDTITVQVEAPSALIKHNKKTPQLLAKNAADLINKNLLVLHADEQTKSGVELVDIALGIARDPASLNKDRLQAIAWIADRMHGSVSPQQLQHEIMSRLNVEKSRMLEALRSVLTEDEVARIKTAMDLQGASLERVETRGRPRK